MKGPAMRTWAIWALGLIGVVLMGGCAVVPWSKDAPVCFVVISDIRGDSTPYVLFEHGQEKRVYGADASVWLYSYLWPLGPMEGGTMGVQLFDHPVQPWECLAGYEMRWGPRQRLMKNICELARGVSPAPYWIGEAKQTETAKRWVLSNEPLVVAVGTDRGPIDWYHGTYSLVREADLDRTATELLVLDRWPPEWNNTGSEWEKELELQLAKVTRRVKLERAMTLREILAQRAWERPTLR